MGKRQFGTIRKLPSGRWQARYRAPDGTQIAAPQLFATKGDASRWLATAEADLLRGDWQDPRSGLETFSVWAAQWLTRSTTANARAKRATTQARDEMVVRVHLDPVIGPRPIGSLTPHDVQAVVNRMAERLAPATVRTNYGVMRAILNAAVNADMLRRSPCRAVTLPAEDSHDEIQFLSPDELERLADALPPGYRAMAFVGGVLGLRWSEVAGLRVGRVDFLRRTVTIAETLAEVEGRLRFAEPKTKASRRTIDVPEEVMLELAAHLDRRGRPGPGELVFVAADGGPIRATNFRMRIWAPAVESARLNGLTFHGLRHTAVGLLVDVGASPAIIQRRMGHASIRTTFDVYGHVLPSTDERVTKALGALLSSRKGTSEARPLDGAT